MKAIEIHRIQRINLEDNFALLVVHFSVLVLNTENAIPRLLFWRAEWHCCSVPTTIQPIGLLNMSAVSTLHIVLQSHPSTMFVVINSNERKSVKLNMDSALAFTSTQPITVRCDVTSWRKIVNGDLNTAPWVSRWRKETGICCLLE
jgi:hypothetical protein